MKEERIIDSIKTLQKLIDNASHIVVMTGAGFSTASNIPDFRSETGLYENNNEEFSPEEILSSHFFNMHPDLFFKYYFKNMVYPQARPNDGHIALGRIGERKDLVVITQNIDGLHQVNDNLLVLELHGSVVRNHCMKCGRFYSLEAIAHDGSIPRCTCGGIIKPDVTLYEEPLEKEVLTKAIEKVVNADLLIISGSSMVVNPAASLPYYFRGKNIVIVNLTKTPLDKYASLIIREKSEIVFKQLK